MSTKTIKRVLDKLGKTTKLSAKRHELSAISDLEESLVSLQNDMEGLYEAETVASSNDEITTYFNDLRNQGPGFMAQFEALESAILAADGSGGFGDLDNKLQTYRDLADELGIDPNDNALYVEGTALLIEYDNIFKAAEEILATARTNYNMLLDID